MKFEVSPLPYPKNALEPWISARTVELHFEKHHKGYMKKLRDRIEGTERADRSLEELIRSEHGSLFNNAAQVWNHDFYWRSMKPADRICDPKPVVRSAIVDRFGSLDGFRKEFADAANGEFGSGWAWLVRNGDGKLEVVNSSDAENPLQRSQTPLLTIDVWEHAYYLDYQNERNRYVDGFVEHLLDWDFVAANL